MMENFPPPADNPYFSAIRAKALADELNVAETGDIDRLSSTDRLDMSRPEFTRLVAEMSDDIKSGRWTSLLVDDVSGRIPGLVIHGVMEKWCKSHDQVTPGIFFVASGRGTVGPDSDQPGDNSHSLYDYLRHIHDDLGERTLIVTEAVTATEHTGGSVQSIGSMLQGLGTNSDVAVLYNDSQPHHLNGEDDARWYGGGSEHWSTSPLYAHRTFRPALREAIGVEKYGEDPTSRSTYADQSSVNEMRQAIGELVDDLYDAQFGDK